MAGTTSSPLLYLNSPEKFTVAIGLATFRSVMRTRYDLLMAASAAMILPIVVLFFFAQRYFIQGRGAQRAEGLSRCRQYT